MPSQPSLPCPWCDAESADADRFRMHLMVQHRKSKLATYVLHDIDARGQSAADSEAAPRSTSLPDGRQGTVSASESSNIGAPPEATEDADDDDDEWVDPMELVGE